MAGVINDLDVHPRIISATRRAGFVNSWKILENSLVELKKKTNLSLQDAENLMKAAAKQCSPSCITGLKLAEELSAPNKGLRHIKIGCCVLDKSLGGGIPCRGLTEIAGESGCGKTQLALQLALQCQLPQDVGIGKAVVYICTESQFPVSRLNQLIGFRHSQKTFNGKLFADNIFVHHLPEMDSLIDCVRYQLPQFISQKGIGLVIIDSVAAVFRASEEKQKEKSRVVQQLGVLLRRLAEKQNVAILAVNQVVSVIRNCLFEQTEDNVIPALGLSWSNLVTTRLMLRKTPFTVPWKHRGTRNPSGGSTSEAERNISARVLDVVFCPWLPRSSSPFIVTEEGIRDAELAVMSIPDEEGNFVIANDEF